MGWLSPSISAAATDGAVSAGRDSADSLGVNPVGNTGSGVVRHRGGGSVGSSSSTISPPTNDDVVNDDDARRRTNNNNGRKNTPLSPPSHSSSRSKIHDRRRGNSLSPFRRGEDLLRTNRRLILLGGATAVIALCSMGYWAMGPSLPGGMDAAEGYKVSRERTSRKERKRNGKDKVKDKDRRHHGEDVSVGKGGAPLARGDVRRRKEEATEAETGAEAVGGVKEAILDSHPEQAADRREKREQKKKRRKSPARHGMPKLNPRGDEHDNDNSQREVRESDEDDESDAGLIDYRRWDGAEIGEGLHFTRGEWMSAAVPMPTQDVEMKRWGYDAKPRMIGCDFRQVEGARKQVRGGDTEKESDHDDDDEDAEYYLASVQRLSPQDFARPSSSRNHRRHVNSFPADHEHEERHIDIKKKSKKYLRKMREQFETDVCVAKHDWQIGAYPNCNALHELELGSLVTAYGRRRRDEAAAKKIAHNETGDSESQLMAAAERRAAGRKEGDGDDYVKYLAHGFWRDVWVARTPNDAAVLKTLRYEHDFDDRNYDRHRRDALASMRLSGSPNVVDIYAYCSNTAMFEYGDGGDIDKKIFPYDRKKHEHVPSNLSSYEMLDIAHQVARGIADIHGVEADGVASIAHTDITPSQFIYINGRYKVNDFNRCRFMRVNSDDKNTPCGFKVGANPGKFRSPEEYAFKEENEMIDVYSMGNIFFTMVSGEWPFEGLNDKKVASTVKDGHRPHFPQGILRSKDPAIEMLVKMTKLCWQQNLKDRPKAAVVRDELRGMMEQLENASNVVE